MLTIVKTLSATKRPKYHHKKHHPDHSVVYVDNIIAVQGERVYGPASIIACNEFISSNQHLYA